VSVNFVLDESEATRRVPALHPDEASQTETVRRSASPLPRNRQDAYDILNATVPPRGGRITRRQKWHRLRAPKVFGAACVPHWEESSRDLGMNARTSSSEARAFRAHRQGVSRKPPALAAKRGRFAYTPIFCLEHFGGAGKKARRYKRAGAAVRPVAAAWSAARKPSPGFPGESGPLTRHKHGRAHPGEPWQRQKD
jgi:hypothetical protein